jgi:hypothetical protein
MFPSLIYIALEEICFVFLWDFLSLWIDLIAGQRDQIRREYRCPNEARRDLCDFFDLI